MSFSVIALKLIGLYTRHDVPMGKKRLPRRPRHVPQRTCIACRQKSDKRRLTRIVRTDAGVIVDPTGKRNGRGAYVCDRPSCWDKIVENVQLLNQALITNVGDEDLAAIATFKPMSDQDA